MTQKVNIQINIKDSDDFWKIFNILNKYFRNMGIRDEYYANQYCIYFYRTINMFTSFTRVQQKTNCINCNSQEFILSYEKMMNSPI